MPDHIESIFDEARGLASDARATFLDRACGTDRALRVRVEALLAAADAADDDAFLRTGDRPAPPLDATVDEIHFGDEPARPDSARLSESPGSRIGPYRLLQLIGEGGFGSVFMAEQEKPVRRKVALKIIKLGMDTRQVIARFEAERQALALMDHPNIAKVLDAGATEAGRPYFVMELVKGDPIVEYCDKNNLSIEDRLELFAQVCNAVQHAHTKGIIHRDIKPSNILVSTQDGRPNAKVIDFGIAKATSARLTEKTLFTEHKALIGTPEYMSPEQAEGSLDIDTRTDVYSLGVLLYELLTGTTPFSSKELRSAAYAEIQRIIREVEPPKPSTRISSNAETIASVAARRHTEPKRLGTLVRGELDWIVMKALEKDRQRRYETANGLAMDIRRHLAGEAVLAAPPSTAYRARKFVRRNKGVVTAGAAVAAALLLGLVGTAWQAKRAANQRDLAEAARASEADQRRQADAARAEAQAQQARAEAQEAQAKEQEAEAKKQAAIAEAVAKFQTDMLAAVDPNQLPKDPATGEPLKDAVTVVQAMAAAVKVLDEGALKDQPLVEARVRRTIGSTLHELARYDDAEPNLRKSVALLRTALPAGHRQITATVNNLAVLLQDQNKLAEAESLLREVLATDRTTLPAGHPSIAIGLDNLAKLLQVQDRLTEAESLQREALAIRRAALPAGHPDIAVGVNNLAMLLQAQNKLAEAEPLLREALELDRAALPAGHPELAGTLTNLASLLLVQNELTEAEPLLREAIQILRAALPAGHPEIAPSLNSLGRVLQEQNRLAEAEPLYREALAINRAALPAGHPHLATSLNNLAMLLQDQNKFAEAEPLFREACQVVRTALPAGHPSIATILNNLSLILLTLSKFAEAEPLLRECLSIREESQPDAWTTFNTKSMLGGALLGQKKYDEAEPLLLDGFRGMKEREAAIPPRAATRLPQAAQRLVDLYTARGDDAKTAEWRATLATLAAPASPASKEGQ
jgi:serine/threonine protein kinase